MAAINNNIDSDRDFSIWWWYMYQRMLVLFLDLLIRKRHKAIPFNAVQFEAIKKYWITKEIKETVKLKKKMWEIIKKWPKSDILLEWDRLCFEDINFLYKTTSRAENYVFIQSKGNGTDNKIGICRFKEILVNFYNNSNFKNDTANNIFILITNYQYSVNIHEYLTLSKKTNIQDTRYYSLITDLIDMINNIPNKSQANKKSIKEITKIKKINITRKIINNWKLNCNDTNDIEQYFWIEWWILKEMIEHINKIIKNTYIIEHLSEKYIKQALEDYYKTEFGNKCRKIWEISSDKTTISQWSEQFEKYLYYWNTYFISNKKANELKSIEKWKFFN